VPEINGVTIFELPHRQIDERGAFTKILSLNITPKLSIEEVLLSKTKLGFVRGMHFQNGPFLNNRIISCVGGKVFDVLLDLRPDSSTFQCIFSIELDSLNSQAIYVPAGVAHGFQSLENSSQMLYFSDKIYNSNFDSGIVPIEFGIDWPIKVQGMSKRDATLPTLSEYLSRIE
jgi:dTDP-4-dehydrorhamnose 3,5-epimerase